MNYIKILHACDEMAEQDEDFVKEFLEKAKKVLNELLK